MISAESIRKGAWIDTITLESLLRKRYANDHVIRSEFLGITNSGHFCYQIGYQDIDLAGQGLTYCKVFVSENTNGELVAEY
jgi:hypothetical protein